MFLKIKLNFLILILLVSCASNRYVFDDLEPLMKTKFYHPYLDNEMVKKASTLKYYVDDNMLNYLVDSTIPLEYKIAVINAIPNKLIDSIFINSLETMIFRKENLLKYPGDSILIERININQYKWNLDDITCMAYAESLNKKKMTGKEVLYFEYATTKDVYMDNYWLWLLYKMYITDWLLGNVGYFAAQILIENVFENDIYYYNFNTKADKIINQKFDFIKMKSKSQMDDYYDKTELERKMEDIYPIISKINNEIKDKNNRFEFTLKYKIITELLTFDPKEPIKHDSTGHFFYNLLNGYYELNLFENVNINCDKVLDDSTLSLFTRRNALSMCHHSLEMRIWFDKMRKYGAELNEYNRFMDSLKKRKIKKVK